VRSKDDFRQLFNIAASVGIKPGEIPMSSPQMTSMFGFFSALIISLGFVDILSQVAYWPSWLCQHVDARRRVVFCHFTSLYQIYLSPFCKHFVS
jgi:hypothetical protein